MPVCRRCGRELDNPYPKITNSGKDITTDIICADWCSECNAFCAAVLYRHNSAYRVDGQPPNDPLKVHDKEPQMPPNF